VLKKNNNKEKQIEKKKKKTQQRTKRKSRRNKQKKIISSFPDIKPSSVATVLLFDYHDERENINLIDLHT